MLVIIEIVHKIVIFTAALPWTLSPACSQVQLQSVDRLLLVICSQ